MFYIWQCWIFRSLGKSNFQFHFYVMYIPTWYIYSNNHFCIFNTIIIFNKLINIHEVAPAPLMLKGTHEEKKLKYKGQFISRAEPVIVQTPGPRTPIWKKATMSTFQSDENWKRFRISWMSLTSCGQHKRRWWLSGSSTKQFYGCDKLSGTADNANAS